MNATEEATPFKVVNDRWQGFGTDMEIGQTIEGNFSPGHSNEIFNDFFSDDRSLSDSPATNEYFMRTIGKLDSHLWII